MKASVNIKMEETLRDQAKEILAKMGLDMTTAVNMFLLTTVREKRIPFEITLVTKTYDIERYEELFAKKIKKAEEQEKNGDMRDFDSFSCEIENKYDLK